MGGIYQGLRTGATAILLAGAAWAGPGRIGSGPEALLWSQPTGMASGDRFLALGYARGVELWDWPPDSVPALRSRLPGPDVITLWGSDSTLYWCASDSVLRSIALTSAGWTAVTGVPLGVPASEMSGSQEFVAVVAGTSGIRYARRPVLAHPFQDWSAPGNHPVAYLSIRDSTAAVAGADWAFLVRLRDTGAELLDSLPLGAFVQAVQWAGDTLYMGFGFSGLKMIATAGDRFADSLYGWSSDGTYSRIVVSDQGCAGVDFFGRLEIFERGGPFVPKTRMVFDGTLRTALGRGHQIAVLTVERGLSLLNAFTIESPFWSHRAVLPGFVRDLEWSPLGVLAFADFSGVYALGITEDLVVHHPYNAVDFDVEWPLLAATSLLGGVGVADLSSGSDVPYAVVPTPGLGRRSVIAGQRLFVAGDGACDRAVVIYDLSTAGPPVEVTSLSLCGTLTDMAAGPGVVALAMRDSGLRIVDGVYPVWPALATTAAGETWDGLTWQGEELWGRNRTGQLARWRWNGSALLELERLQVPGVRCFDVWDGFVATADSSRTLSVWYRLAGQTLAPFDSVVTRYVVSRLVLRGDTLWAVDRDVVIRYELQGTVDVVEPPILPEAILLDQPYPNPFNSRLVLNLHLKRGAWNVTVTDLLGRTVARWNGVAVTEGPKRLVWASRELSARASGLYLVQAENAGSRQSRKVLFLK